MKEWIPSSRPTSPWVNKIPFNMLGEQAWHLFLFLIWQWHLLSLTLKFSINHYASLSLPVWFGSAASSKNIFCIWYGLSMFTPAKLSRPSSPRRILLTLSTQFITLQSSSIHPATINASVEAEQHRRDHRADRQENPGKATVKRLVSQAPGHWLHVPLCTFHQK